MFRNKHDSLEIDIYPLNTEHTSCYLGIDQAHIFERKYRISSETEGINNRIKRGKQAILGNFALLCECSRAHGLMNPEPERKKMADPPLINNRTEWSRDWAENLSFSFTTAATTTTPFLILSFDFSFSFLTLSLSLPLHLLSDEGGRPMVGGWNGEWILCPERDIWRPLRPGKNNINIGKERRESFAGWLALLLWAGDIKYNHNNKRPSGAPSPLLALAPLPHHLDHLTYTNSHLDTNAAKSQHTRASSAQMCTATYIHTYIYVRSATYIYLRIRLASTGFTAKAYMPKAANKNGSPAFAKRRRDSRNLVFFLVTSPAFSSVRSHLRLHIYLLPSFIQCVHSRYVHYVYMCVLYVCMYV